MSENCNLIIPVSLTFEGDNFLPRLQFFFFVFLCDAVAHVVRLPVLGDDDADAAAREAGRKV
jgi:hypothetical protein